MENSQLFIFGKIWSNLKNRKNPNVIGISSNFLRNISTCICIRKKYKNGEFSTFHFWRNLARDHVLYIFGPVSAIFIKRLATLHSEKYQRPYSITINMIRCRYSFAILKAAIRCLRGSRSKVKSFDSNDFIRAASEAHLTIT